MEKRNSIKKHNRNFLFFSFFVKSILEWSILEKISFLTQRFDHNKIHISHSCSSREKISSHIIVCNFCVSISPKCSGFPRFRYPFSQIVAIKREQDSYPFTQRECQTPTNFKLNKSARHLNLHSSVYNLWYPFLWRINSKHRKRQCLVVHKLKM